MFSKWNDRQLKILNVALQTTIYAYYTLGFDFSTIKNEVETIQKELALEQYNRSIKEREDSKQMKLDLQFNTKGGDC